MTVKSVAPPIGSNCEEVANLVPTRAIGDRYVYAAAARADEESLDTDVGGLATARDLDVPLAIVVLHNGGGRQFSRAVSVLAQPRTQDTVPLDGGDGKHHQVVDQPNFLLHKGLCVADAAQ